ncbi:unnamed protein product, partial [Staurois parvus]
SCWEDFTSYPTLKKEQRGISTQGGKHPFRQWSQEQVSPLVYVSSSPFLVTTALFWVVSHVGRGGLTTHGGPRAIGDHGAPVSLPKQKSL